MTNKRNAWRTAPGGILLIVLALMLCISAVLAHQAWDAARSQRRMTEAALRDYARFALWELGRRVEMQTSMTLNAVLVTALTRSVAADSALLEPPRRAIVGVASGGGRAMADAAGARVQSASVATGPSMIMRALDGDTATPDLADFADGVEYALRSCACDGTASDFFVVDLATLEVQLQHPTLGPSFRSWLGDTFPGRARVQEETRERARRAAVNAPPPGRPGALAGAPPGVRRIPFRDARPPNIMAVEALVAYDPSRVVVYAAVQRGASRRLFGFALHAPAFARAMIVEAVAARPLLPASLTGAMRNEDMLSVTAWMDGEEPIYHAGDAASAIGAAASTADPGRAHHASSYAAAAPGVLVRDTIHLATGQLVASIGVRPELAGRLLIGGLPRTRLPILAGSVGLTVALLLIAMFQLHRQRELFRMRADFVSGVSHELRTPLAQIHLFSELLATDRLDDSERRRSIRILSDEARRLTYLVESVLRFSQSGRRLNRIAPVVVQVRQYLRGIVDDFAPLATHRDARINVDFGGLPAFPADADLDWVFDPDAMRQVLLNLLDNAVKYGPQGQSIRVIARVADGWLSIEVVDEGPGIPAADRERIWEPYRRLTRPAEAAAGGTGIGLAVARELVTLHGGRAFVVGTAGPGSRFVVMLPWLPQQEAART